MKQANLIIILLLLAQAVFSQNGKTEIRQGNRLYQKEKFNESEVSYRRALKEDNSSYKAAFNLGDALYKQEKYADASSQFSELTGKVKDKGDLSKVYHNLGNSYLMDGKVDESIDAYKNALRYKPDDMETKYNLAYAQLLKKKQEEQQKKDQQKQQQDQKNQEQQEKDQEQNKSEQDQKQKQQEQKLSKEDAERMLNALQNDEKEQQDKVKKQKVKPHQNKPEKDW